MSKINQENQGMLKMLQDISILLKDGKRIKASQIRERTGLELKHWVKLRDNHLVVDEGKSCNRPIYKWDTIKPNIDMAIEALKDVANFNNIDIYQSPSYIIQKRAQHRNHTTEMLIPEEKIKNFIPPSEIELKEYCKKKKYEFDQPYFLRYWEGKNWFRNNGKDKVVDWKLTAGQWEANQKKPIIFNKDKPLSDYTDHEFDKESKKRNYRFISDEDVVGILKKRKWTGTVAPPPQGTIKF